MPAARVLPSPWPCMACAICYTLGCPTARDTNSLPPPEPSAKPGSPPPPPPQPSTLPPLLSSRLSDAPSTLTLDFCPAQGGAVCVSPSGAAYVIVA